MRGFTWMAIGLLAIGCSSEGAGGGSGSTSSTWPSGCPFAQPREGAACPKAQLGCSYGDGPTPDCRERSVCTDTGWMNGSGCDDGTPAACAAGVADGVDCAATPRLACLGEGTAICVCSACEGSSGAMCNGPAPTWRWACTSAPPAPCPAAVPNDGTACTSEGAHCLYGFPCHDGRGVVIACEAGTWVWQPRYCPG